MEKIEGKKKEVRDAKGDIVEKKKNIIMRHKLLFLICFMATIVMIALIYIFFSLFVGGSDPYGDRLKGISKVTITSKKKSDVSSFLKEKDEVVDASVSLKGKIINVHIKLKDGVSKDRAKEIANESLSKFDDDEKKFYDFGFFAYEEKADGYVLTGTKNSNSPSIVWIKS